MCSNVSVSDRRLLAKVLGTMATESPTISYRPYVVAEAVMGLLGVDDDIEAGFDANTHDMFQLDAPLLFEFCLALDRMHGCGTTGEAMRVRCGTFLQCLTTRSIVCGTGGPVAPECKVSGVAASNRSKECLQAGICASVRQVRHRRRYELDGPTDSHEGCRHALKCRHALNNYVTCSRSYNLSLFFESEVLNSQTAEKCNTVLKRSQRCVGQMKQATFVCSVSGCFSRCGTNVRFKILQHMPALHKHCKHKAMVTVTMTQL